jgi:dTDP-4-dehydrorhamnose reductase
MRALITGAGGQLGMELIASAPPAWTLTALTRADLDIGDADAVRETVDACRPDVVINAAAYVAVDRAEGEPEAAFRVNRDGAGRLARAAVAAGARMVHISTDFVFDGRSGRAYRPDDGTGPLNVYGASKLAGEHAVRDAAPGALIVRTAWVYAAHGSNFMRTMLRLMAERPEVRVVADQIGTPTAAASLARALWRLIEAEAAGTFHYTDAGAASWYDFAQAIGEEAHLRGLLPGIPLIVPIITADYPTPAPRPAFSVLDNSETWRLLGAPSPHWRVALRDVLAGAAA